MSEITKLYENAGIRPNYIDACTVEDKYWQNEELANEYGTFDMYMNAKCGHQEDCTTLCSCAYTKEEYPPFTAEKQLELIKWLARKGLLQINYSSHQCYQFNSFRVGGDYKANINEALASHCNNLWQDLTEKEKEQIREILK